MTLWPRNLRIVRWIFSARISPLLGMVQKRQHSSDHQPPTTNKLASWRLCGETVVFPLSMQPNLLRSAMALALGVAALWTVVAAQTPPTFPGLTIELEDHVAMPITGKLEGAQTPNGSSLARVNAIRE